MQMIKQNINSIIWLIFFVDFVHEIVSDGKKQSEALKSSLCNKFSISATSLRNLESKRGVSSIINDNSHLKNKFKQLTNGNTFFRKMKKVKLKLYYHIFTKFFDLVVAKNESPKDALKYSFTRLKGIFVRYDSGREHYFPMDLPSKISFRMKFYSVPKMRPRKFTPRPLHGLSHHSASTGPTVQVPKFTPRPLYGLSHRPVSARPTVRRLVRPPHGLSHHSVQVPICLDHHHKSSSVSARPTTSLVRPPHTSSFSVDLCSNSASANFTPTTTCVGHHSASAYVQTRLPVLEVASALLCRGVHKGNKYIYLHILMETGHKIFVSMNTLEKKNTFIISQT